MKRKWVAVAVAAAFAVLSFGSADRATAAVVDVQLQLLVDVSGSISTSEFNLQRSGYSNAFRSASVRNAILDTSGGRNGGIAVEMIYWSAGSQQSVAVGWSHLNSVAALDTFADAIDNAARSFSGNTGIGSAISFGSKRFATNGFTGGKKIIDVSGDGTNNSGVSVTAARDAALSLGIDRINGLAIGGGASLLNYYKANVIGGTNSFAVQASDFDDFGNAVKAKIRAEVVPLPPALFLLVGGIATLGAIGRRRKARVA